MSQNMLQALGRVLAMAREGAGLTQEEVCARAEVNAQLPSKWENGKRWPGDADIAVYSELAGVPIEELWIAATRRCIDVTLTQLAEYPAVRAQRRSERLAQRSRRSPPPKPKRPEGD